MYLHNPIQPNIHFVLVYKQLLIKVQIAVATFSCRFLCKSSNEGRKQTVDFSFHLGLSDTTVMKITRHSKVCTMFTFKLNQSIVCQPENGWNTLVEF